MTYTVDESIVSRLLKYILSVERILNDIRQEEIRDDRIKELVKLSRMYLDDARYYFTKGDYFTSLSCIAYAEGLLDSLRILGFLDFKWSKPEILRVMVGGTFDIIHPGHIYYLREASKLGLVYAVVARDSTVRRIKNREPVNDELTRLELVSSIRYVYRAILGDESDIFKSVDVVNPNIIMLGPDQPIDEDELKRYVSSKNLNVKILRLSNKYKDEVASTSKIIKKIIDTYCRT